MTTPTTPPSWDALVDLRLEEIEKAGRWREPREFDARGPRGLLDGRPVVSFASNDYLGLAAHPAVVDAAHGALDRWGAGAGASRLITGSRPVHAQLEAALADWKGTEAAVVFPTGFAANLAVLSVFGATPATRIFSDELNHASIVDGARLARATVEIYRHADPEDLARRLAAPPALAAAPAGSPSVVVTDTVFSMDGDLAPLGALAAAIADHPDPVLVVLDEAHAVLGPKVTPIDDFSCPVLLVGTLSKTLGALGGFVAGPRRYIELLVNAARPYIFTTALSPPDAAAALAAVGVLRSEEGEDLRQRLAALATRVATAATGIPGHPSPIIPVILGDEGRALAASADLLEAGLWVPAIRPPTVPEGTSRLRVTVSAAHTDDDVDRLCAELVRLRP